MRTRVLAACAATLLAVTMIGPAASARKFNAGSQDVPCGDGTVTAVEKIRNRNHKLRNVVLVYNEASDDGDTLGLTVDAVTHEEEGFEKGSTKKHEPDFVNATPSGTAVDTADAAGATVTLQLRGERLSKPKDGRTYTLDVTCTDDGAVSAEAPTSDTAQVLIKVPHSNR